MNGRRAKQIRKWTRQKFDELTKEQKRLGFNYYYRKAKKAYKGIL